MMSFLSYQIVRKAWRVSGLLALFVTIGGGMALAQSDWDMGNRIKRLENEVDTLSRAVYRGESPPPGAGGSGSAVGADVEIRLQQVENDMRELRGLLEQQGYENRQLKDQLERVTGDLELRLNDLEGAGASGVSGGGARYTAGNTMEDVAPQVRPRSQTQSVGSAGGQTYQWSSSSGGNTESGPSGQLGSYSTGRDGTSGTDTAAATYDNAFSLVKNRQYDRAQVELEAFLEAYPAHALAGNAKYWLGETYYVRGNFEKSARVFAEGYQQYPKGSKAADNLLKLGLSLEALGKRSDACIALQQLKKENPAGSAPVLRRADQEMSRLAC